MLGEGPHLSRSAARSAHPRVLPAPGHQRAQGRGAQLVTPPTCFIRHAGRFLPVASQHARQRTNGAGNSRVLTGQGTTRPEPRGTDRSFTSHQQQAEVIATPAMAPRIDSMVTAWMTCERSRTGSTAQSGACRARATRDVVLAPAGSAVPAPRAVVLIVWCVSTVGVLSFSSSARTGAQAPIRNPLAGAPTAQTSRRSPR